MVPLNISLCLKLLLTLQCAVESESLVFEQKLGKLLRQPIKSIVLIVFIILILTLTSSCITKWNVNLIYVQLENILIIKVQQNQYSNSTSRIQAQISHQPVHLYKWSGITSGRKEKGTKFRVPISFTNNLIISQNRITIIITHLFAEKFSLFDLVKMMTLSLQHISRGKHLVWD